jgi:hypothetical protein
VINLLATVVKYKIAPYTIAYPNDEHFIEKLGKDSFISYE